jgi:hypothetical protein
MPLRSKIACGNYRVRVNRGKVRVHCGVCGYCGEIPPLGARRLASRLMGPRGRFEIYAPRAERQRLAGLLTAAADRAIRHKINR